MLMLHLRLSIRHLSSSCSIGNFVWLRAGRSGDRDLDSRQRRKDFSSSLCVQTGSGATKPPVQWVPGVLSPGLKRGRGMTLTTHPHLVPRSWMSRSYTSSSPCASIGMLCDYTTSHHILFENIIVKF
jgi:hypothetical protein